MVERIERECGAIKCECGGYATEVECTKEEIRGPLNCGSKWACCVAAFVCGLCNKRHVRRLEAPEAWSN